MGLIIDSGVFILWERSGRAVDFSQWASYGDAAISVVTASELLVGVHRADTSQRRANRSLFVEGILSTVPTLPITSDIARKHAGVFSALLVNGVTVGSHDLWIGATALSFGFGVLTTNAREFQRIPGLVVIDVSSTTTSSSMNPAEPLD
ncbi:MAG: PIN domain-containing protein [Bythopirellula sp.]|nr:PIN domain-containing protein [Bythopirellula sp.]